ncbi:hypothetical protein M433DRAFT_215660 [Acidomyces richmondensis BFW]|nr:MAG: hypothetical protein FE78DRAFT_366020 [Acidomyces sp. 'richmondensis']KYG46207.1 hypothetical protein M433DRAFT_215660 [Acidomyces richmondensis BFW]
MPRNLPWLAGSVRRDPCDRFLPATLRLTSDDDVVDEDVNPIATAHQRRQTRMAANRTPSSSPPPAPAHPPDIEFMRPGFAADDVWMMVEDEFLSTAQTFTRHIHEAEYARLKKVARARGEGTLAAIAQPMDGRASQRMGTLLHIESRECVKRAREGIERLVKVDFDGRSEDENEYTRDPQLAGLMMATQTEGQELTRVGRARTNTRAAAGFVKRARKAKWRELRAAERTSVLSRFCERKEQPQEETADEEGSETDDEDADFTPHRKDEPNREPFSPSNTYFNGGESRAGSNVSTRIFKSIAESIVTSGPTKENQPDSNVESLFPKEVNFPTLSAMGQMRSMSDYLSKRRTTRDAKGNKEETRQKTPTTIDVPTFII